MGQELPLRALLRVLWRLRNWNVSRQGYDWIARGPEVALNLGEDGYWYLVEWPVYESQYLPPFSLSGATVLDIGAEYGVTTYFWLKHGAKRVYSVEPDRVKFSILEQNATQNHWPVIPINERFKREQLYRDRFDFVKIDCEGGESVLLEEGCQVPAPFVVETHGSELTKEIQAKFGLKEVGRITIPRKDRKKSGFDVAVTFQSW